MNIKIYRKITLFLLLYGCVIWSHIEGEHRMRVFENMVTKKIRIWAGESRNNRRIGQAA